jgi:hypothetical protein
MFSAVRGPTQATTRLSLLFTAWAAFASLPGQEIKVYSEFQRPDPFGAVVKPDRGAKPREILSPAVVRGAFISFHIAVSVPAGENYFLYIVPNPVDACRVALYKEQFTKTAEGWIPDKLEPLSHLPHFAVMPDPAATIPGQTTRAYLLDVWIPPEARPPGFRLEVQLKVGDWVVWPMEIRVLPALVPVTKGETTRPLPPVEKSADVVARVAVEDWLGGVMDSRDIDLDNVRAVIRRNAVQDVALLKARDREALRKVWEGPRTPGAEWYLRVRDWIYRH